MTLTQDPEFGDLVRSYRRDRGLTQEELAEEATLSVRAISDLERGLSYRPRKYTVQLLADALRLSAEERSAFQLAARGQKPSHDLSALPAGQNGTRLVDGEADAEAEQHLPSGGFLGSLPGATLVARVDELSTVLATVEAVEQRQGRLVLIAGEAGIGKTRLAQEVTRVIHDRKFLVAAGRCYEPQRSIPYYPFLEALRIAYEAAPASIRDQAGRRWPYLSRLLPDQLGAVVGAPSCWMICIGPTAQHFNFCITSPARRVPTLSSCWERTVMSRWIPSIPWRRSSAT
jgi:transcriptional regulator with XRE-family HTH domain